MRSLIHTLLHAIVIEKKSPDSDEIVEEELKPAGFVVTMRRPKAKDLKAFDRHGDAAMAAVIEMIIACSRLSQIEVENLDAEDFGALGNLLDPPKTSGRMTGSSA